MTNRFEFPVIVDGRRTHVGVGVERRNDDTHLLTIVADRHFAARDLVVPPQGIDVPIEVSGIKLLVRIGPAKGHLASIVLR